VTASDIGLGDPAVLSYGFCALAFFAFLVHLALGWRGGIKASVLVATVAASVVWATLNVAFALTEAAALWRAQAFFDSLRLGGWLLFLGLVLGGRRESLRLAAALALLPVLALWWLPAAPSDEFVAAVSRVPFGLLLGVSVAGLVLSEQVFRRARAHARWAVKPLCIGLGASFVFDLYLYADALLFGRIEPDAWAARGFAQALVIPFIVLATARNREWTIDIALSRGVVFQSTAFLASGIYLLAIAAAGYYVRYFGGSWGRTFQVGFVFAALLLLGWLFSSGTLRSKLRVFINKNFFSYRYDYRQEWLRFTSVLSTREPNVSVAQRAVHALADLVESPAGALWLLGGEECYVQEARWNFPRVDAAERAQAALPDFLQRTGWVVNLQEYRDAPARYPGLQVPEWLGALPAAWLIVPIAAQDELIGFVVLATPRAAVDVNWEVRDLLKTAARQAGSFLAQLRASEALLEARKFEAFNKMTAFVVHDLKNLVAQLSLLLSNAERHRHNPRFQEDMLATVQHVSERMNRLLLQLSTGARGEEGARPVDLSRLAERVARAKAAEPAGVPVEGAQQVMAVAHEHRLERVVGHLVQNAIDATREGGGVRVRVSAQEALAVLEVSDTGCGMSEQFVRERLFRPFETTKAGGMGIGAFETAQYVKEIGGSIQVESRPGTGTRVTLALPLHRGEALRAQPERAAA
jgi:hypothetical protein